MGWEMVQGFYMLVVARKREAKAQRLAVRTRK